MKTKQRTYLATVLAIIAGLGVLGLALAAAPDRAGAWRLPFSGAKVISNAPGVRTHTKRSSQAIQAQIEDSLDPATESFDNGQHLYASYDWNQNSGNSNNAHIYEVWQGNTANGIPHIAASYVEDNDATTLEYCVPNAAEYYVSELKCTPKAGQTE